VADILMPQLGETVTEGTITKWFKNVGDTVAQDEVLFEVSTDKVDSEVPSAAGGVLSEIRVPEGETVDVGTVLAVIGDSVPAGATSAAPAATSAAAAAPGPGAEAAPPPAPPAYANNEVAPPREEPGAAQPIAAAAGGPPSQADQGQGSSGAPQPTAESENGDGTDGAGGRLLSPIVRRLINDYGIDANRIQGTGPGGRITRSDVEKAIESGEARSADGAAPAPAEQQAPAAAPAGEAAPPAAPARPAAATPSRPAPAPPQVVMTRGDTSVPLNRIRRITGEHMVMSKATSAHTLTAMEVDFEGVDQVRRALRDQWRAEEGSSLTYLPFVSRAVCDAIREFPYINASVGEGELILHGEVNLGIAVDLNFEGLVAPVVRHADDKRLRAIAREIVDLADRARSKRLNPDDLSGGTFTITNPGQYGTMMQFPIINQPQVAILSTDGVKRKPVVVTDRFGNETIAIHSVGVLALAWDHRAFDGAYAAAFLAKLRDIIEQRDWNAEVA
jgi:2-oxoglutarate dehydrogenase E2 component (dihydrolipoamide succinyltransferase)